MHSTIDDNVSSDPPLCMFINVCLYVTHTAIIYIVFYRAASESPTSASFFRKTPTSCPKYSRSRGSAYPK